MSQSTATASASFPARPKPVTAGKVKGMRLPWIKLAILMGLHIPLAVLLRSSWQLAVAHAWLTFFVGMFWAVQGKRLDRIACVGAYIAGAEVLWRMTNKTVFIPWEFGKYATSLIFIVALVRSGRFRIPGPALVYLALLIPSALIPFLEYDWATSRRAISSNISGPFSLVVCTAFFSRLRVTGPQYLKVLLTLMAPIVGVGVICYLSTFGASDLAFGRGSNVGASGGFGPNQVSATFGLGILAAFLCITDEKSRFILKAFLVGVALFFAVQSALTLSRTGLYLAALSAGLGSFYLVRSRQTRLNLILSAIVLYLVINFAVFPWLDSFTGGALSNRFKNTGLTNREEIAMSDLKLFLDEPLFGVGMGLSQEARAKYTIEAPAHTEFSRLLSEHGLFGCAALGLLLYMCWTHFKKARTMKQRALAVSMLSFTMLFMFVSGMRLNLASFTFGIAAMTLAPPILARKPNSDAAAPSPSPTALPSGPANPPPTP